MSCYLINYFQARAEIQKTKFRLQKELDEAKKALDYEKQLRADAENSKKMLHEQLRELFALVDEFDYGIYHLINCFILKKKKKKLHD